MSTGFLSKKGLSGETPRVQKTLQSGDMVCLRLLSVAERLALGKKVAQLAGEITEEDFLRTVLVAVAHSLCEEDGTRMWSDEQEAEGVATLMQQPAPFVNELKDLCLEVNGMGEHQKAAIKEAVGNSGEIPS